MAVAFDASNFLYSGSVLASIDVSLTTGSGSDMVLLATHWVVRTGYTSSSVSYDPAGTNVAFTKIGNQSYAGGDLAIYILKDSNISKATSKVIRATNSGSARQALLVASFTGVDQTTPNGTLQSATNTGTSSSNAVSSSTGDMVVDAILQETANSLVEGSGQTEFTGLPSTINGSGGSASYEAGATSVSMDWSWTGSYTWYWLGVNLLQASGGGGGSSVAALTNYYRRLRNR